MLSITDGSTSVVYLTSSGHCYKFERLKQYKWADKKYTFDNVYHTLTSKIYYGGNTFVELINDYGNHELFIERMARKIDSGSHTKPATWAQ